jgi:lysophospholipase L1-like esterase
MIMITLPPLRSIANRHEDFMGEPLEKQIVVVSRSPWLLLLLTLLPVPANSYGSPPRVLLFGDSLTAGQVANRFNEFSPPGDRLQALLGPSLSVTVEGKPLESVAAMPARLTQVLSSSSSGGGGSDRDQAPFDAIVVMGGTNDLWKLDAAAIGRSLEECFSAARRHNPSVRCGHVTLPPFTPGVVSWFGTGFAGRLEACRREANAGIVQRSAAEASYSSSSSSSLLSSPSSFLVDVAALCEGQGGEALQRPDGIHFDAAGYRAIGEAIFQSMGGNGGQGVGEDDEATRGRGTGGGSSGGGGDNDDDQEEAEKEAAGAAAAVERKEKGSGGFGGEEAKVIAYRASLAAVAVGILGGAAASIVGPLVASSGAAAAAAAAAAAGGAVNEDLALAASALALLLAPCPSFELPVLGWPVGGATFRAAALLPLSLALSPLSASSSAAASAALPSTPFGEPTTAFALALATLLLGGREIAFYGLAYKAEAAAAAVAAVAFAATHEGAALAAWGLCLAVLAAGKAFEPLSSDIEPTGSDFLGERPLDSAPPPLDDDL